MQVAVYGVPADTKRCRTKVKHNTNHPIWEDEEFEFPLTVPELALLALEVRPSTLYSCLCKPSAAKTGPNHERLALPLSI